MANSLNKQKTGDQFNVSKNLDLHHTDRIHVVHAFCLSMRLKSVLPYEWLQRLHVIEINTNWAVTTESIKCRCIDMCCFGLFKPWCPSEFIYWATFPRSRESDVTLYKQ